MIVQVTKDGRTARLEILGIEVSSHEKSLLTSVLLWMVAFLISCKALEARGENGVFIDSVKGLLKILMTGSNRIFDSLMSDE